jgi:hypothetical protein
MSKLSENTIKALAEQKILSIEKTRKKLELALQRIIAGTPKTVLPGSKVNPVNVAKEAGIDRATLYRYHEPVLAKIRINSKKNADKTPFEPSSAGKEISREKEYYRLAEEAQKQVAALARINYRMDLEIKELREKLDSKEQFIAELKKRLETISQGAPATTLASIIKKI